MLETDRAQVSESPGEKDIKWQAKCSVCTKRQGNTSTERRQAKARQKQRQGVKRKGVQVKERKGKLITSTLSPTNPQSAKKCKGEGSGGGVCVSACTWLERMEGKKCTNSGWNTDGTVPSVPGQPILSHREENAHWHTQQNVLSSSFKT